ncbi:DNA polymerase alpha/epsilon subunit B-domain-containing protein [Mycena latifolia]|nr:DNA polymerase alpha/epsilon subunit B-domain-containing protein [Mycena latifolia]
MATDSLTQEISTRFADIASDAQLVAECVSVCKNYSLTPEELQYKWEAHNFRPSATRSEITPYTIESLATLKVQIQRERATKSALPREAPRTSLVASINRSAFRNRNPGPKASMPVHVKLEPTADGFGMIGVAGPSTVAFQGPSNDPVARKKRAYRYMHEKPSERGDVLDDRIDEFAERIREHYDLSDVGDPSASTSDDITVVGRIIQDDDTDESAKLGEGAIAFECSRAMGNGARVPLRFDWNLKIRGGPQGSGSTSFFPGAIAALRGKNGGGGYFQVSEILTLPPLLPSAPSVKPDTSNAAFSVFIASGPYTPDADLGFRPWRTLITKINETKPAVVVLLGPFIDALHPLIKSGDVDSTPLNLFRTRFTDPLRAYLDSVPGSIAIIVPSPRDVVSDHAVFPQCELPADVARGDRRIHLLPNPASFALNGVTFAATSVDTLFHLKKGEFVRRGEEVDPTPAMADDPGTDAMANVCRHLLQQRSFYPVFPVPLELTAEVVLDVTHSDGLRLGGGDNEGAPESAPDVLIVPSRLKQFSKTVYATTALNPSFVSKTTYMVLDVAARTSGGKAPLSARLEKIPAKIE